MVDFMSENPGPTPARSERCYVSDFPGTDLVNPAEVFALPGYREPVQNVPKLTIACVVGTILCFCVPPFSFLASVVVAPLCFFTWFLMRTRWRFHPGQALIRGASVVSLLVLVATSTGLFILAVAT